MGKNKLELQWMLERAHDYFDNENLIKLLEDNNFTSILIRTGSAQPDPWTIATFYASKFNKIKFIIAVNPAMISPVFCAIKVITFQKLFGDRISLNIVSGPSKEEQSIYNDNLPMKDRYKRSKEFAEIVKQITTNGFIKNYYGSFYSFEMVKIPHYKQIDIVFAGSSDNTINMANEIGAAHYHSMETPTSYLNFRKIITTKSAIKSTIIVENTKEKALEVAENLIKNVDINSIEYLKNDVGRHESQNQKRQQNLHNYSKDNLFICSNIWLGYGLLRGGGITSMIGSYKEVADLIKEYYDIGLDILLIGGTPEIYYANNFINGVMPILKQYEII